MKKFLAILVLIFIIGLIAFIAYGAENMALHGESHIVPSLSFLTL